ncbi:FG-GAP repeat protein [Candidatus Peregrinibacteria bacterium]|nr:FG-GAP repeat protein [Candidatus Peregrinibacteria bacterium]
MIKKAVSLALIFVFLAALAAGTGLSIFIARADYSHKPGWYFEYKIPLGENHITFKGTTPKEQFGSSLAKGDLNGDSIDDIAIGSPQYSSTDKKSQGKVTVFFGNKYIKPEQKNVLAPNITIFGETKNHQFGTAVAFGDFNNDAIDDLAIGSINADKVYLFLGKNKEFPAVIDLSKDLADITFRTASLNENFGFSLDMADVNSDGISDLIIGAPSASQTGKVKSGKIYVVFGFKYPSPQFLYDFNKIPPSIIIWGENEFDQFGASLSHGDVNADKKTDIIAGAYLSGQKYTPQAGKVYAYFGKHPDDLAVNIPKPIEIKIPDITLEGAGTQNWLGYSVEAGDANNDGLTDIAAGAFMYQAESKTGKAYIHYSKKSDYRITKKINEQESFKIFGNPKYEDVIGTSVLISDINNDKKNDFIVGAPGIGEPVSANSGFVYIFDNQTIAKAGVLDMVEAVPTALIEGDKPNDWFGSVVIAGDFNADKYNDLIIAAPNAYNSGKREGAVYVLFGGPEWQGKYRYKTPAADESLTRAQFVYGIIQGFNLDAKNKEFLRQCRANPEFCLHDFAKETQFHRMKYSPKVLLYPDVSEENFFYEQITDAASLGIMKGFMEAKESPFKPDEHITRIHALRVILEAAKMIEWKSYAELKKELNGDKAVQNQLTPFSDISAETSDMWWYPRYVNYAYLSGIISDKEFFRPLDPIKQAETEEWIKAVKRITE